MRSQQSRLQAELKQTKPFASIYQEADLAIVKTADLLRRKASRIFEPYDLTLQQYNVLRILRGAGREGLPTLDIVERMIEETPGITRLLDRLEAKELVRRERCSGDRRQVLCFITPAGRKLLRELDAPADASHERSVGRLSERETLALIKLLERVRAGLEATGEPAAPRTKIIDGVANPANGRRKPKKEASR